VVPPVTDEQDTAGLHRDDADPDVRHAATSPCVMEKPLPTDRSTGAISPYGRLGELHRV
jgi:hypothetical protein